MTKEGSPLIRVEQEVLKEWMWGIFDEIAYIISMEIGRKYTKVELFDYDLFSKYE